MWLFRLLGLNGFIGHELDVTAEKAVNAGAIEAYS
jgi:hypothetical protein